MAIPLYDGSELSSPESADDEAALPSFTTAIRGYQKDEVHAFLRELRLRDGARERGRLEQEARQLRQRVEELEHSIRSETPHTIDALGERLLLILHHAEAASAEAVTEATAHAERVRREAEERAENHVRQASLRASQAAQTLSAARVEARQIISAAEATVAAQRENQLGEAERIAGELVRAARAEASRLASEAQAQATQAVTEAQALAAHILEDAQQRATALVSDAETHATDLRARALREEALAADQINERRALADAHLHALADQRDDLLAEMAEIHASLARTLRASGFVDSPAGGVADLTDSRTADDEASPTQEQPVFSASD